MVSPPMGIHFRGSGFYKTDSRPQKVKEGTKGIEGTKETEKNPIPEKTTKPPTETDAPVKPKTELPA